MKGILVINKEVGYTSRDVVNILCKIFNTKKIGHTGTLDPMATGVLVVCIGRFTKLVDLITSYDKEYVAGVKLGFATDTLDTDGVVLSKGEFEVSREDVLCALKSFEMSYEQVVPIYSAVRINGRRLYDYARSNEEVKLPSRFVDIKKIDLLDYKEDEFSFVCNVSKGTYIRSLIRDICSSIDVDGVMSSLNRTMQGDFNIKDSYLLSDIKNGNYKLLNAKEALGYEVITLSDSEYLKVSSGNKIDKVLDNGMYILDYLDEEIAIYEFLDNIGSIKVMLKD